jgi:hypothetical protein
MKFNYRGEEVVVDYELEHDDPEYYPTINIEAVYYLGVDILPIMNQADEVELKLEMNDKLFA